MFGTLFKSLQVHSEHEVVRSFLFVTFSTLCGNTSPFSPPALLDCCLLVLSPYLQPLYKHYQVPKPVIDENPTPAQDPGR